MSWAPSFGVLSFKPCVAGIRNRPTHPALSKNQAVFCSRLLRDHSASTFRVAPASYTWQDSAVPRRTLSFARYGSSEPAVGDDIDPGSGGDNDVNDYDRHTGLHRSRHRSEQVGFFFSASSNRSSQ